jgi:bloom syndrome protein
MSDMVSFIKEKYANKCGIIYCLARKDCEKVAQKLRVTLFLPTIIYNFKDEFSIKAEHYHAQVGTEDRKKIQKRWLNDQTKIIVATIAFGLGKNFPRIF